MTLRTSIVFLFLAFAMSTNANAQVTTSQLVGTKWEMIDEEVDDEVSTWTFSEREISKNIYFKSDGASYTNNNSYYLTNQRPSSFCSSLVGKGSSGNYIVVYSYKRQRFDWYIIRSLDKSTGDMYLFRERKDGEIGNTDITIHFKLIQNGRGKK